MNCRSCNSEYILKNGRTRSGKQNFKCRNCVRQFVMTPRHQPISESTKELRDRLLLEKISLAGIVRTTGVSSRWLQYYVNKKLGAVKRELEVKSKKRGQLTIQCDEMWSFVGNKDNKQWIWLGIEASTFINCRNIYWQKKSSWRSRIMGFFATSSRVNVL